ncbi:hypothetical protein F8M41_008246 [Gigaspora margarita]|uniref:Uncharacterized protein n=1 Tax=Gigaspora margarita TaxID=4874 RepID=A0A8H4AVR9_GIGMA|nr:hypothetical protein F8M41_008246 [Gigaspora margarita]
MCDQNQAEYGSGSNCIVVGSFFVMKILVVKELAKNLKNIDKQEYLNLGLKNNLKNNFDIHKCAVHVITKVMLSNAKDLLPVQLIIQGIHRTFALAIPDPKLARINLSLQTHDKMISACCRYQNTGVEITMKVLAPHNNTNETHLTHLYKTYKDLCTEQ